MDEQQFLCKLILRIGEEPSLYKLDDHNYSNDNVRHQAFLRIQDKLKAEGATQDQVVTIRDKFRILKRRFASEHRRKGGQSQWPFYEQLSYLAPCVEYAQETEQLRAEKRKWSATVKKEEVEETVPKKACSETPSASSDGAFDKESERMMFEAELRQWLITHPCCGIKSRATYEHIAQAITMKNLGHPFPPHLKRDYEQYVEKFQCTFDENCTPQLWRRGKRVTHEAEVFDILHELHQATAHARRDVMFKRLNEQYEGISKNIVIMFLKTCRYCEVNGIGVAKERLSRAAAANNNNNNGGSTFMDGAEPHLDASNASNPDYEDQQQQQQHASTLSLILQACEQDGLLSQAQSPDAASTHSSIETGLEAAVNAYNVRQTYLFMKSVEEGKSIICKVNDEDFFPPHKCHQTASQRCQWTPGEIITAYMGFEQVAQRCVVEAIGDREKVQADFVRAHQLDREERDLHASPIQPDVQRRFDDMEERLRFLEEHVLHKRGVSPSDGALFQKDP